MGKMPSISVKGFVLHVTVLCVFLLTPSLNAAPAHEFAGSTKCGICHKSPAQGEQYRIWKESPHSKAYETLGTPEAKAVAEKLGIANPEQSGKCLRCHSTAYYFSEEKAAPGLTAEEGVSCESCHGPGKDYMKMSVMKDRNAALAAGLMIGDETLCRKCHNEESPTFKPFDYAERWEKIKHPVPKKA